MVEGNNNNSHNFVDLWQSLRWDVPRWQNDDDLTAGAMFDENRSYPSSDHENLLISDVFHGLFGVAIQVYSKQKNCPLDMIHPVIQSARRFFLLRVTLLCHLQNAVIVGLNWWNHSFLTSREWFEGRHLHGRSQKKHVLLAGKG